MRFQGMVIGALLVGVVACARVTPNAQPAGHGSDRVITRDQLLSGGATNVYEAIGKVRPQCLTPRTSQSAGRSPRTDSGSDPYYSSTTRPITLYVDGTRLGNAEDLRSMSLADVAQVECLTASDAAQRFGLNNVGGAIVVRTGKP